MSDDIEAFRKDQLAGVIQKVTDQLSDVAVKDIATIPERIFQYIFLPLFAGDENRAYPVTLENWAIHAGSPYRSVHVVDTNNNILFTVPPLFDRAAINPVSDGLASIAHVVATAGQYANIHPTQGIAYLNHELSNRALVMKVPPNVQANLKTWNEIFARYNRPLIQTVSMSDQTTGVVSGKDSDFEFEML